MNNFFQLKTAPNSFYFVGCSNNIASINNEVNRSHVSSSHYEVFSLVSLDDNIYVQRIWGIKCSEITVTQVVFTCKSLKLLFISNAVLTITPTSYSYLKMDITYHVPVPKANFRQTSRDDRLQIQTLYHYIGFTIDQIVL